MRNWKVGYAFFFGLIFLCNLSLSFKACRIVF